jgi:predicted aminopeptidase
MRLRLLVIALLLPSLAGCANFGFYTQAVRGQFEIYSRTRPIADVIADPDTSPALKEKLRRVLEIRDYASRALALPDNNSYRVYADLKRPYALWNVFATPELSLKPIEWCFLITGCVSYRGYFSRDRAEAFAGKLRSAGDDVYVGGVRVYSTLGWFNDPVLNTIIQRPLPEIAGLVFHELAHQRLYVKGDTTFSESFAVTVQLEGVRRWLRSNGAGAEFADYRSQLKRRDEFIALMMKYRDRLDALYRSDATDEAKRAGKRRILAALRAEYLRVKTGWNDYSGYDAWFAQNLNNAYFVSIGTYYQLVPAFQALLARCHDDLPAFYRAAEKIAKLPGKERMAALNALLPAPASVAKTDGIR